MISAKDGCKQIGPAFTSVTVAFPPGALSTIGPDSSTRSYNFADLACPPSSVKLDSGEPDAPRVAPPDLLFDLNPAFRDCIAAAGQGVDPPTTLGLADLVKEAEKPGFGSNPPRHRRAPAHAHVIPWIPQKTA